ncbi:SLC13 family permease [Mailhella massiliensis]|uniref:SLC13 family permease n=1 Tax=Mailhella massiliensis TaxID=1903261 RepID=UPI0023549B68|nr:SLC13 family permease [Mailhella massiliensis]
MSFELTKNGPKFYANLAVMILIMVGFRFITPPEGLTADGLAVVGVFFGVLYGWLFLDMIWPSFVGLVVLGMTLPQPMDAVLGGAFGNNTFLLLLFFCMVASIINAAGIAEYVARRIICVPIVVGRPWVLIFMLCIAMCALATMLTMTAAVLVAFPLIKEVCRQYGYKPGDAFPMILLLAMLYVADIAYMMLPFKSLPAIVFGIYGQMSGGQEINLASYVAVTGFLLLVSIFFVIFICKFVLKADVSPILNTRDCMHFEEQLSPYQKTILWSFLGLIVLLLLPNILPGSWALSKFLKAMGNNGILLAYIGIYLMLGFKEGIGLKEIMHKSVAWPALFLVAAVLRITGAFEATGVTKFIADTCEPMLAGFSGNLLVFIVVCTTTLCTQLTNNNACAATFAPIAYTLAVANGNVDPQALLSCVILSCTLGIATPAAATTSAILYGDTEWVHQKTVIKYASYFWIFNILLLSFVGYPLMTIAF